MKFPKFLNVLGTKYKLEFAPLLITKGCFGEHDDEAKTIRIDDTVKGEKLWKTFIHELKHAQQAESGMHQCLNLDICEVDAEMTARVFVEIFDLRFKKR